MAISAASRRYYLKNKIKRKNYVLMSRFGMSLGEYNQLLKEQNECCKICGQKETVDNKTLSVDHCHKTGKVRGLLCHSCNVGLGAFKDNPESLKKAIDYLSNMFPVTTQSLPV